MQCTASTTLIALIRSNYGEMHHFMPILLGSGIWSTLKQLGIAGQVLLGIADASVVPTPGSLDALTVLLAASNPKLWWIYAIAATIGSVAGGYLTYRIGVKGGKEALEKRVPPGKLERVYSMSHRYGFGAIMVPAIMPPPVPLSPFLIAAGAMKVPRHKFITAFSLGRFIRYGVVAFLGKLYGRQLLSFVSRYEKPILWMFVALAVAGGSAATVYFVRRKQKGLPVFRSASMPHGEKAA